MLFKLFPTARIHPTQVTENGVPVPNESEKPLQEALRDVFRLDFYRGYIEGVCQAVAEDGVNLTGYYAWSLMDNFEWLDGYRPRFGITYVSTLTNMCITHASMVTNL